MNIRTIFFSALGVLLVWFLFIERAILAPFIFAGIFAYIFNPFVNFFSEKLKVHRAVGIFLLFAVLLIPIIVSGIILSRVVSLESLDLSRFVSYTLETARSEVHNLPDILQPVASNLLINLQKSKIIRMTATSNLELFFSQALSRVVSAFIFLFSSIYFLKDGQEFVRKLMGLVPKKYKGDVETLFKRINIVLGGYLRGQLFLVFFVSVTLYIALFIIGVRFALTLAIFSGLAEIVPVIGPITAGTIAVSVVLLTGTANFGLSPIYAAFFVALIYFLFRQLEDYLVIPVVMEKITKLPPIIVFFAVIAGGHLGGVLGLILAVPTAAVLRLLFDFSLDKINAEKAS
ncbi:MAG: AI-2E family transporter [Patescibacteria group bacterium]|nr:AI-2E family transporter [Patescibacteria group bacterium]MDE2590509.1 AI-2E family transporter [Patescibacteria group bacterium]